MDDVLGQLQQLSVGVALGQRRRVGRRILPEPYGLFELVVEIRLGERTPSPRSLWRRLSRDAWRRLLLLVNEAPQALLDVGPPGVELLDALECSDGIRHEAVAGELVGEAEQHRHRLSDATRHGQEIDELQAQLDARCHLAQELAADLLDGPGSAPPGEQPGDWCVEGTLEPFEGHGLGRLTDSRTAEA